MAWRNGLQLKTMDDGMLTWAGDGLTCYALLADGLAVEDASFRMGIVLI
jgi:hypothetical protein